MSTPAFIADRLSAQEKSALRTIYYRQSKKPQLDPYALPVLIRERLVDASGTDLSLVITPLGREVIIAIRKSVDDRPRC